MKADLLMSEHGQEEHVDVLGCETEERQARIVDERRDTWRGSTPIGAIEAVLEERGGGA